MAVVRQLEAAPGNPYTERLARLRHDARRWPKADWSELDAMERGEAVVVPGYLVQASVAFVTLRPDGSWSVAPRDSWPADFGGAA